jgi:hypothetical protein
VKSERNYQPILEEIRARHPRLFDVRAMMRLEAADSRRYALYFPDREIVWRTTDVDGSGEEISVEDFVKGLLRSSVRPDYGRCPSQVIVINAALFDQLRTSRLHRAVIWTLERLLLQSAFVVCQIVFAETKGQREAAWQIQTLPFDMPAESIVGGNIHVTAVHCQTLLHSLKALASGDFKFNPEPRKSYHQVRLELFLGFPTPPSAPIPGAIDAFARLCALVADIWTREGHGIWSNAQIDRYRCGIASPADFYFSVHRIPSVLPLTSTGPSRHVALVIDPACSALTWPALGQFAAALAGHGWTIHLVGLGKGGMVWSDASHALFASVIPLPLTLADPERATESRERLSRDADSAYKRKRL